jgi:hypothetical protein
MPGRRVGARVGAIALGSLLFASSAARAQDASSAQALFDDGRRLMAKGKYAEACPKLAASQKIDPGAGTLLNLATCYERAGKLASAWVTFKEAASAALASGHADWAAAARERADAIEPKLVRLSIVVPPDAHVTDIVVLRDGRPLQRAEWGTPVPVDAGAHTLEAKASNRAPWSSTITVTDGAGTQSVTVPILPEDATRAESRPTLPAHEGDAKRGATQRVVGLVAAGAGAAAVGAGAVLGFMARATHDDALTHCNSGLACDAEGVRLGDRASSQATASTIAFLAGGALIATGAVLYFVAPSAHPMSRAWLAPVPIDHGAGASVGGVF